MLGQALVLTATLALLLPAELAWGQSEGFTAAITGSVAYRQRIALPSDATVVVRLEDVSRADAPATSIAVLSIVTTGQQVPIPFELHYDPSHIEASHRYSLRATISANGGMLFTTTTSNPVITQGSPTHVNLMLNQVTPAAAQSAAAATATSSQQKVTLDGTYWKLTELGGKPVLKGVGDTEAHLILHANDKRIAGSSGCNRMAGGYELDGDSLHFKPAGMTMMACSPALLKQERTFNEALTATTSFRIVGHDLEFRNGNQVVAHFQARYLK